MEMVFIRLLNMSISASWLILAVVLLRRILKGAPKWIRCILWGLVALRLIFPVSVESIFSLLPTAETIPQDIIYAENPVIHTGVTAINSVVNPYLSDNMAPDAGVSVNPMQIIMNLGAVIWAVGMIGMMIYAGISYLKIRNRVSASLPARENIYFCDYIDTPFVLGIVRPRIYLPSALAEEENASLVVAHEKAHIRRHDHWWKPLGFLLLTVYWFNPVIWVAYILLCRDIELACDEYVVSHLEEEEKCAYSDALLACSIGRNRGGLHHNIISACPLAFGEVGVKDRVKAVLHYKRPAFWLVVLGVIGCIIVALCFLTNPKDNTLHAPEPFGHSYRVQDVVYGDLRYSFAYTPESAPRYQFTSDYGMLVSGDVLDNAEGEEWLWLQGKFEEAKLSPLIFDDYFKNPTDGPTSMIGPDTIRVNTEKAWRIDVEDNENNVFYYFILTKQGEIYLTYGYDEGDSYAASKAGSLIRWVFKLARTDILSCNAVSEDCNAYVQPAYYPEGFDWDYEQLPEGHINAVGKLIFTVDWDTDTLIVSEDYYRDYGNSTTIEKETYTLTKNRNGQFELDVALRGKQTEKAFYFIQGESGVYVLKIVYGTDKAVLKEESVPDKFVFEAEIEDIKKGYFVVEPVKGSLELNSGQRIEVPIKSMESSPEPQVGDIIEIEYSGEIMETYPARLGEVYSIRIRQGVEHIIGYSALYDEELIKEAYNEIEKTFAREFAGCTLKQLRYDEKVENRFADAIMEYATENKQELIIILSSFETDDNGGNGGLNPNDTYTDWQWHLVRSEDKNSWKLISWGY